MTVVDASAIVDLLAPPSSERRDYLLARLPAPSATWLAPDILPFEVFAVLRRFTLRGALGRERAGHALERLARLPIELLPTVTLLGSAWLLRERFAAADSLYAALALRAHEPLLTSDLRLARAAAEAGIEVQTVAV